MDKAKFKARLLDLVRECVPFEQSAKVTMLMSIRLDDRPDAINVDVAEELTRPVRNGGGISGGSKRKSQAPQRMVPSGEDSFVPAATATAAAVAAAAAAVADASSSFNADLSGGDDDQQPLNLSSRHGSPAATAAPATAGAAASTPLKPPTAAFQLNNPDLALHFGVPVSVAKQPIYAAPQPDSVNAAAAAAAAAVVAASKPSPLGVANGNGKMPIAPSNAGNHSNGATNGKGSQQKGSSVVVRTRRPGNRSFPCNQCGQVFSSLAGLSKHTFAMHKVYKCTFCGANFTQRSNLQRHSLKHVGFKPFECRCCRKSYYRKDHLVRHIEVTHPGHDPKLSIDTRLSSAECLQYLERKHETRDYTSLSGVVMSAAEAAAAAAAAASEGGVAFASEAPEGDADDEAEQLMMMDAEEDEEMDEEGDEAIEDLEVSAIDDEAEADDGEEIDVGSDDQQPIMMMEQPVAE